MSQREEIKQRLEGLASNYETLPANAVDKAMGMVDRISMQYKDEILPEEDKRVLINAVDRILFKNMAKYSSLLE